MIGGAGGTGLKAHGVCLFEFDHGDHRRGGGDVGEGNVGGSAVPVLVCWGLGGVTVPHSYGPNSSCDFSEK